MRLTRTFLPLFFSLSAMAAEPGVAELVQKAVQAAGGAQNLPQHFAWKEEYTLNADTTPHPRTAVLHPPEQWFQEGKDIAADNPDRREKTYLACVWTLRPLLDPQTKLKALPSLVINGKPADGLLVSQEKNPDISMYFDHESGRLLRMDWRKFQIFFDAWTEKDGFKYPAKAFVKNLDGSPHVTTVFKEFILVAPNATKYPASR